MRISSHPLSPEQLMAYLDGELPANEAALAASHLQHCRECQEIAADLQGISRQLLVWQVGEPSPAFSQQLQAALSGSRPREKEKLTWFRYLRKSQWTLGLVASSVVLVIVISAILSRRSTVAIRPSGRSITYMADYKGEQESTSSRFSSGVVGGTLAPAPAQNAVPPPPAQDASSSGPLIIRTAELSLTTSDFSHSRESITRILASHSGYIAQLEMNTPTNEARSLDASLRIPAAQLDAALSDLKRLGHVDSESQRGEEVTQRVIDVQARLANLRTTEARLIDILRQRTGKLADVLAVEEQIDSVRGQIENMEAEQKNLNKQIAFATVQLKVKEEYKKPLALSNTSLLTRLRNAAVEGFQTLGSGIMGVLLFFLSYGPTLLIVAAVLFYPARRIWKRHSVTWD